MIILAVESSCDETAVALVQDGRTVLADCIASSMEMHKLYGGVVPEIASRKHIEVISALADQALNQAGLTRKDIDADTIFFDAVLQDTNFYKRGAVVITGITQETVKVQFLEKRSYQNFFPRFDEKYINELDLGEWPSMAPASVTPQQMSIPCPLYLQKHKKHPQVL